MTFGFKPQLDFFSTEWMSARSSDRNEHELGGENIKDLLEVFHDVFTRSS